MGVALALGCGLGAVLGNELERAVQYREQAAEMLRLSERIVEPRGRQTLIDLAATYHRIAAQLEEIDRLDIKPRGDN
jgi:hypothetical protein